MGLADFAGPSTGRAGCNLGELAEEAMLGASHPTVATASGAGYDRCTGFVASSGTPLTLLLAGYLYLALGAENRLL